MKNPLFPLMISLACFTISGELLAGDTFFVYEKEEPGSLTTCTFCDDIEYSCCTLLDALNLANLQTPTSTSLSITSPITYTDTLTTDLCNEFGNITIQAYTYYDGSVINFNGQSSDCGAIFQPTYLSSSSPGNITLINTVFQNSLPNSYINIAGGSLTINGTSTSKNASFSNNEWRVGVYSSHQPALTFDENGPGIYSVPFQGNILFTTNGTTLALTNNVSSSSLSLTGNIAPLSDSVTGSILNFSGNDKTLHMDGNVTIPTLNISTGKLLLSSSSNSIATITVETDGQLQISSSGSISLSPTTSTINLNTAQLVFTTSNFTPTNPLGDNITLNLSGSFNYIIDSGYNITIASKITGSGPYVVTGGGIQTLTNTANDHSGGTFVDAGILSIDNILELGALSVLNLSDGNFFASDTLTLPSSPLSVVIRTTQSGLSALSGKT